MIFVEMRHRRTDIGVVNLGQKSDLGWGHWVLLWEKQLQSEDASCNAVSYEQEEARLLCDAQANGLPSGPWMVTSK